MEDERFWTLAAKLFAGEASDEEARELEHWIEYDPVRRDLLAEAAQAWEQNWKRYTPRFDSAAAWRRFERLDDRESESNASKAGSHIRTDRRAERKDRTTVQTRRFGARLSRTAAGAAALVATIVAVILWQRPENSVIATTRAQRLVVDLPDGTRAHLNAETELVVREAFEHGIRDVRLSGEAYFNVASDEQRPFVIRTSQGAVRVVGTAFNVNAYEEANRVRIAVAEGAVALLAKSGRDNDVVLRPNQLGEIAHQRLLAVHEDIDITPYLAWKEGRLVFVDAPFPEVVARLERCFDLEIDVAVTDSVDLLNAVFEDASAGEVLHDVALALALRYEQNGKRVRFFRE